MTKPGPRIDPARAVQVTLDAAVSGDEAAASRHHLSTKTVARYRALVAADAALSDLVARKKTTLAASWLAATDDARQRLLRRVLDLADRSRDLRDVAGALKIVTDANAAERVIAHGLGEPGAGAAGPGATPAELSESLERFAARAVH